MSRGHDCTCYPGGPHEGCDEFDGGPQQDPNCPVHGDLVREKKADTDKLAAFGGDLIGMLASEGKRRRR